MVIEMVFNNKIQVFFFSIHFIFLKEKYIVVYIIEKTLRLNLKICHLDKLSIKYQILYNVLNQLK
jgi:hypothetical protein